jgi:hypothetical protein
MASAAKLYVNGVKSKLLNYYAAWLPDGNFRLGDYGVLDGNLFTRLGSVADAPFNFRFAELADPDPSPIEIASDSGVSLAFKAAGEANPKFSAVTQAEAGIAVEFSKQGAFVISAPETYEPSIADVGQLQNDIVTAYKAGRWKSSWAVIVRTVRAPVATILASRSSQGKVEFSITGAAATPTIALGDLSLGLSVKWQSGDIIRIAGGRNIAPFFQLARIRRRFPWGRPEVGVFRAARAGAAAMDLVTPDVARADNAVGDALELELI